MSTLITDANKRTSLYALRSLGSKEIEVTATEIEDIGRPIGFYSKYCKQSIVTPNQNSKMYIPKMVELAKKHEVLIPISTDSMLPISKNINEFEKIIEVPVPGYEQLVIAQDKSLTLEVAKNLDIPCPKTFVPHSLSQLRELALKFEYPVVIKHRESSGAQGVVYAQSPEDLISKYTSMHQQQEKPLVQEYIKGRGFGAFALFNKDSKPVATFVHKRLREYPITGGQSTFCESVKEPAILKHGLKILKELNWYGLAMVEFKVDHYGEPKIMEINPRFWGSMPLAIAAGVDFPYLLYKLAIDGDINRVNSYKVGIKTRFIFSDTLACLELFLKTPNKISTVGDYVYPFFDRNVVEGLFVSDDPRPAFQFFINRTLRFIERNKR